jgi:hypothetical protein
VEEEAPTLRRAWPWFLPVLAAAAWVHWPTLTLGFLGDDYQWWQHARMALERPWLLLGAYGGYRPANTWTLALDQLLFGTAPFGYRATNLLLHLVTGTVLWRLLARFEVGPVVRAAVALLWLCSPFTFETVIAVANRFDLLQLTCWLAMACLWPGPGQGWPRRRLAAVVGLALLTLLAKESWVILPGLVAAFDLCLRREPLRRALLRAGAVAVPVAGYLLLYFAHPAIPADSYFTTNPAAALKVPQAWAAFLGLSTLRPLDFQLGPRELMGVLVGAGLAWLGWRRRSALAGVGFAFALLPWVPVLPVGFLTTRYTAAPYAGFLLVMVASVRELLSGAGERVRRAAVAVVAALAILVQVAGLYWLAGDRADMRRYDDLHRALLAELDAFLPELERAPVLVVARLESANPLRELSLEPQGTPKLYFPRPRDPYGLVDWPALLSYRLDPLGGPLYVEAEAATAAAARDHAVVGHAGGRFVRLPVTGATAAESAAALARGGAVVRILKAWGG